MIWGGLYMGWEKYFRTYFWTRKIPCTWTKVNSDLLARLKLYDMRWPLHGMGKIFQNLLLDKENSLHMNRGKLWPTCKAWVIWYEVAFTWDWKRISFQNLLVEKDNGFSLQKNLHETQVSLMCHVLWHESIWYIKVTGTIWRKILSIYKKNLSIRVAALLALSVILWISDLLLFSLLRKVLMKSESIFGWPEKIHHRNLFDTLRPLPMSYCGTVWSCGKKKRLLFSSNGWGLDRDIMSTWYTCDVVVRQFWQTYVCQT